MNRFYDENGIVWSEVAACCLCYWIVLGIAYGVFKIFVVGEWQ